MVSSSRDISGLKVLIACACLVVIMAGLRAAAPILLPVSLALLLTIFSLPLLSWLQGRGVRFSLAMAVTMFLVLGLVSIFAVVISRTAGAFLIAAPGYIESLEVKVLAAIAFVEQRGIRLSDWIALGRLDAKSIFDMGGLVLGGTVRGVASLMSFVTLVTLAMLFMLPETVGFRSKLAAAWGPDSKKAKYFQAIVEEIEHYLEIKTAVSVATGILIGIWVAILGVPFPLLWGLIGFLFNYVPNVGSILASIVPVLITLVHFGGVRAAMVAAGYLAINLVLGNVIEPKLMGRRFGLSTLVVILSLIFWGWLWGPFGMLLAVPLTVIVKIALSNSEELQWAAVLLGPSPRPVDEEVEKDEPALDRVAEGPRQA